MLAEGLREGVSECVEMVFRGVERRVEEQKQRNAALLGVQIVETEVPRSGEDGTRCAGDRRKR